MSEEIRLTQYSHGAGCGCKINPKVLNEILQTDTVAPYDAKLIVGNSTKDDAAVYDLGNGTGLISTTDFFMPVVDDAETFGKIASANAISDVYAMGGKPLLAVAILGWPLEKLSPALARNVIEGARKICAEAGIPLAGGHSIDSPEPIFGLAVSGLVGLDHLKRNSTAKEGDLIYLTKPIGVGILTTAGKRAVLNEKHKAPMIEQMTRLNTFGEQAAKIEGVTAMTDVTGFGLLGHLLEMAEGAELSAELNYSQVPLIKGLEEYTSKMVIPDSTFRNWNSYEQRVEGISGDSLMLLCDPQTNGGLMITVTPEGSAKLEAAMHEQGLGEFAKPIGRMTAKKEKTVFILS